jgi:ferredoxin
LNQIQHESFDYVASLQQQGWRFIVPTNCSLLEAALAAGIKLLSSCRNGSCRTCMCKLVSGQVKYKITWPSLSREEKEEGFILPCVAMSLTDVVLEVTYATRIE